MRPEPPFSKQKLKKNVSLPSGGIARKASQGLSDTTPLVPVGAGQGGTFRTLPRSQTLHVFKARSKLKK